MWWRLTRMDRVLLNQRPRFGMPSFATPAAKSVAFSIACTALESLERTVNQRFLTPTGPERSPRGAHRSAQALSA